MNERFELTVQYLMFAAEMNKLVEIEYKYLHNTEFRERRYGSIQPIKWVEGKHGMQILAWDTVRENWRRFDLFNIERVHITDEDWVNTSLTSKLTAFPH